MNFDVDYYDLAFLDKALELLGSTRCAIVVASKRAQGALDRRPLHRRVVTLVFTTMLSRLFGMAVTDAHGMKAMRRDQVAGSVEACVMTRSLFDVELVLRAGRAGLEVLEVPAVVVERRPPRSAITKRSIETVVGLARLALVLRGASSAPPDPAAGGAPGGRADAAPTSARPAAAPDDPAAGPVPTENDREPAQPGGSSATGLGGSPPRQPGRVVSPVRRSTRHCLLAQAVS